VGVILAVRSPRDLANAQLVAYNARDLDAFCALFADDVTIHDVPGGKVTCTGMAAFRAIYANRFASPDLHCEILSRMDLGDFAIDRERVTGIPGGPLDVIAIYEARDGLIRSVRFIRQPPPA
jgi:hypothetical protein